ncbi:MAG TPA: GDSL-type esterase/lipase family protein [Kofleriaceae bacterium]|nr:GDSL-type esterase/lipase family protein [Kofleriaceae bacterium]
MASVYVALGDSMSIDLYPESDASERLGITATGLGAASLFHRNVDGVWPEHAGLDLATRFPGIELDNRTCDGAMIDTVLDDQLHDSAESRAATIATLTIAGNDLLMALGVASEGTSALLDEVRRIKQRYAMLLERARSALPRALLVVATIYDPSDGTGYIWPGSERLPIELLKQVNDHIRQAVRRTPDAVLADVHTHFLGHGVHVARDAQWYWPPNPIEPSARGASEIRRVFWNALDGAGRAKL